MGMVKAGGFLQQSYVAVGGGSDIHVDLLLFSQEKFIQDHHIKSADIHLNIDGNGQNRRILPTKLCGRDPATLSKLEDLWASL